MNAFGISPFHLAIKNSPPFLIRQLLGCFPLISPNVQDLNGNTPLQVLWADEDEIPEGKYEKLKLLLQQASVNIQLPDKTGATPIWKVVQTVDEIALKWLIASGRPLDLDAKKGHDSTDSTHSNMTPLEVADRNGNQRFVNLLIELKQDPLTCRQKIRDELKILDFPIYDTSESQEIVRASLGLVDWTIALTHPGKVINIQGINFLDLCWSNLASLSENIGACTGLISLTLDHNELEILPSSLFQLSDLKTLKCAHNKLRSLSPEIGQFLFAIIPLS